MVEIDLLHPSTRRLEPTLAERSRLGSSVLRGLTVCALGGLAAFLLAAVLHRVWGLPPSVVAAAPQFGAALAAVAILWQALHLYFSSPATLRITGPAEAFWLPRAAAWTALGFFLTGPVGRVIGPMAGEADLLWLFLQLAPCVLAVAALLDTRRLRQVPGTSWRRAGLLLGALSGAGFAALCFGYSALSRDRWITGFLLASGALIAAVLLYRLDAERRPRVAGRSVVRSAVP